MGARVKVELTDEQTVALRRWTGVGKTEQRMALRARIVLLASEGMSLKDIEKVTGLSWQSCLKWRKRFLQYGLEGLQDLARRGRPQSMTPEEHARISALADTLPFDGSRRWSVRKLAEATGHSKSVIQKSLVSGAIKSPKITSLHSDNSDMEFEEKMAAIIGLYLNPPTTALVLSIDVKSQPDGTECGLTQMPKRITRTRNNYDTVCLLTALTVHSGTVVGPCENCVSRHELLKFLKSLHRKYPEKHLHVIVGSMTAHKDQKIRRWLDGNQQMTMHYTPTHSSWLTLVEIWFNLLIHDALRDDMPCSKQQVVSQIMRHIANFNPLGVKPFKWVCTGMSLVA